MANIVKQISKKNDKIEKESKQLKQKYEQTFAYKEELAAKYLDEKERHERLQLDYETLESDVQSLIKVEKLFNEIKGRQKETSDLLDAKSRQVAELRPKVEALETERQKLNLKI
jgi:phage shock protein A